MATTLLDLLKRNSIADVLLRIVDLYPDQASFFKDYEAQYTKCLGLTPVPCDMRIMVYTTKPDEFFPEEEPSVDVSGTRGGTRREDWVREHGDKPLDMDPTHHSWDEPEHYGLSMTPWAEWVGMVVEEPSLAEFPEVDILAHCLWEMSWHGFDEEDAANVLTSLKASIDEYDQGKVKGIPMADVLASMESRIMLRQGICDANVIEED